MGNGADGTDRGSLLALTTQKKSSSATTDPIAPAKNGLMKWGPVKRAFSVFAVIAESALMLQTASSCGGSVEAGPQKMVDDPGQKDSGKDVKDEEDEAKDANDDGSEASLDALIEADGPDASDGMDSTDSSDGKDAALDPLDAADSGLDSKGDSEDAIADSDADVFDSGPDASDAADSAMQDAPADAISDTSQDPDSAMPDSSLDAAPDGIDSSLEAGNTCYEPFTTSYYNWMGFGTDYNIANIFVKTTGVAPEEIVDGGMLGKGIYVDIYRSCSITNVPLAQHLHVVEFEQTPIPVTGTVYTLNIINYDHSSNSALNMVDITK